jgi:TatD DNase family protein
VIDSHTHLDTTPGSDAEIVAEAREAGVTRILTIGMDPESCARAQAAAEAHEEVFFAAGHHPNSAGSYAGGLEPFAAHPKCRAIGETGLDHFRDYASTADQERAFHAQIELAREHAKPLVIHTRAAEDDTIATLAERAHGLEVILHCFSMPGRLEECLGHGWWISFAGNVTYPKAGELRAAAADVPAERLLAETDSPYLAPQPVRGQRNEPANVLHTVAVLAEARGQGQQELAAQIDSNAAAAFRLP